MSSQKKQQDDIDYGRDVQKLQTLWKQAQKENIEQEKNLRVTKKEKQVEQVEKPKAQNYYESNLQIVNKNLREKLDQMEIIVQKGNQNNEVMYRRIHELEAELQETKDNLVRLQQEKNWKANQADDLHQRLKQTQDQQGEFLGNARQNAINLNRDLDAANKEIQRLNDLLNDRNQRLNVVTVTQERNVDKCIDLDRKLQQLQDENRDLRRDLESQKHKNDLLKLDQKAEGTFLVEVEHLRSDVKRLVKMLRSTQEFQDFAEIADENGNIRFLKDVKARSQVDDVGGCVKKNCVYTNSEEQWVDEKMLWAPEEAWKFAHEFRLKFQGEMSDNLIEHLMFELNKIWSRREARIVKQVKANCAHEVASLKRQLAFNPKYDEHQAKNTIQRLKNQLKQAYKENRELFAERQSRNPPGTKFVQETLKMQRNVVKSKKDAEEKNQTLRQKLTDIQNLKFIDNKEKSIFFEGVNWICNKIFKENKEFSNEYDKIVKEYDQKVTNDPDNLPRKTDWMIENVRSLVYLQTNRIQEHQRNSEKEMAQAGIQINKITRPQTAIIDSN